MAAAAVGALVALVVGCAPTRESAQREVARSDRAAASLTVGSIEGPPRSVGPSTDHPDRPLDRDAGVAVELSDGSVVWFFGDTAQIGPDGGIAQFTIGSAAWARADSPTVTRDPVGSGPAPFAEPVAESPVCPPSAPTAGLWPLSAVLDPRELHDRVVLWMLNICLGPDGAAVPQGVAVGEWRYDPTVERDEVDQEVEVEVTILNAQLFADTAYGVAAVADGDRVYVYGCDSPASPDGPTLYGPCRAARVELDDVAEPTAYEAWTGNGWSSAGPPEPVAIDDSDPAVSLPVGPFSVSQDAVSGAYLMVYSPWPGYTGTVALRIADRPEGPWGAATLVDLPGCDAQPDDPRSGCYGAIAEPALTTPGRLAIGYQDQWVDTEPRHGSFMIATVPFEVLPAG